MGARVGVTDCHREPERDRDPVRARESQLEPVVARVGVTESQ